VKGTRHADLVEKLMVIADRIARQQGLELVELTLRGSSKRRLLRVDIDRAGPRGVELTDCQLVSGLLGDALDEQDVLSEGYVLEVSSPGLDRPIRSADDFRRNVGRRVVLTTREPVSGRSRFVGVVAGIDGSDIRLRDDSDEEVKIGLEMVETARQEIGF
jgi:ribosome maturation factor RimP